MRTRKRAFTIIELVVVLAIISVVLLIGLNNWRRYRANQDLKATVDKVVAAIKLAKTNALQFVDGVNFNATTIPAVANGEFIVFDINGGAAVNHEVFKGYDTSPVYTLVGTQDYINGSLSQVPTSRPLISGPLATPLPAKPFGAFVALGTPTVQFYLFFAQNGVPNGARTFTLSNGFTAYTITMNTQGQVTVTQPDGQIPQ